MSTHSSNPDDIRKATAHDEIARRAYELWEREGRSHGHHERHWREAERQLRSAPAAAGNPAYPSLAARERIVTENIGKDEPVKKLPADAMRNSPSLTMTDRARP